MADGFDRLTVKTNGVSPALPSGSDTSPIDSSGVASSFWIVPVPPVAATVALTALPSATVNVSSVSCTVSPFTSTSIVCVVVPGGNVSSPLPAA